MTRTEIMELGFEELETRSVEIAEETKEATEERLGELNEELDAIEERRAFLKAETEKRKEEIKAVADGAGKVIDEVKEERKTMANKEIRNSHEYVEAFAKYIKTGKDAECRALLTENVTGGMVPVPEMVESRVRQAWENDEIFSRVAKTFVRGNLKVGFEISATDAVVHTEGAAAPAEENLVLGIVNMVPANIKKWITVSDEVLALGAEEFLAYIYDELTYKIIQKAADIVIEKIQAAPATSDATHVGVAKLAEIGTVEGVIDAMAKLGDSARDLVFIANGTTIAGYKKTAFGYTYPVDPFQGATVIKKDNMDDNDVIIGDLTGVQANLPEGEAVTFKFDDLSLAEKDMVKIVGRLYAAIEVVGPKMFVVISQD